MCGSKIDPYGFERPDNFDATTHEEFMSQYLGVLARRAARWNRYMRGKKRVSKSAKCTSVAMLLLKIEAIFLMLKITVASRILELDYWFNIQLC